MKGLPKWPRALIYIGAFVFFVLASGHLYFGYPSISNDLSRLAAPPGLSGLLKAMWLLFALHWIILGAMLLVWISKPRASSLVAVLCGLISIVDGVVITYFAGAANVFFAAPGVAVILGGMFLQQPVAVSGNP